MRLRDDERRWGFVSRLLHWTTAVLIALQFGLVVYILSVDDLVQRFGADQLHKSWGTVIFCITLFRVAWRLGHRNVPVLPFALPAWQVRAARMSHLTLYALLVAIPLTGWIYASASPLQTLLGIENLVFGTVVLPDPWPSGDQRIADIAFLCHRASAILLLALVTIHVGAALKHHFVDRDDVLARMLL